jgi:predicted glycosyltransferase
MWRLHPDWVFAPDLIPESTRIDAKRQVMRYPGLKEDVYIPQLRPDPSIKAQLGLNQTDLVVTVRPPATEAHYHNPEAEKLLDAVLDLLTHRPDVRVILVPRNEKQVHMLRMRWDRWIANRKIIIPEHVVNGLNLLWFSDFVISGGATMNREAAA